MLTVAVSPDVSRRLYFWGTCHTLCKSTGADRPVLIVTDFLDLGHGHRVFSRHRARFVAGRQIEEAVRVRHPAGHGPALDRNQADRGVGDRLAVERHAALDRDQRRAARTASEHRHHGPRQQQPE